MARCRTARHSRCHCRSAPALRAGYSDILGDQQLRTLQRFVQSWGGELGLRSCSSMEGEAPIAIEVSSAVSVGTAADQYVVLQSAPGVTWLGEATGAFPDGV